MSNWDALLHAALLGTRRESPPAPQAAPDLDPLLAQLRELAGGDPGHQLLGSAGALDLYEQIGRPPRRGPAGLQTGPPVDDQPPCPPAAAALLAQLLDGPRRKLLPEFLAALQSGGWRVPPGLLPNLLAAATKNGALRPLLLPVLGRQGRWLAGRNPAWAYAAPGIESWSGLRRVWTEAPAAQRAALVEQLRRADPARGRALVETAWRTENDHTRLRLIKLLDHGLSMADEPLLESALDDRSHLVRRQAAELLAQLPASRHAARMQTYVPAYFQWTPGRERQITVSLPQVSPAMRRDGIVGTKSKVAARVRSQEMIQLLSGVPLAYWAAAWGAPAAVLAAIDTTLWPRTLTTGFVTAVQRQQDPAWANEIVRLRGITPLTARLIPTLSPQALQQTALRALHERPPGDLLDHRGPLVTLLRRWPGPWPPAVARSLLALFASHMAQHAGDKNPHSLLRGVIEGAALTFPPALAAEAQQQLQPVLAGDGVWRPVAATFVHTLRLRQRIHAALPEPTQTSGET